VGSIGVVDILDVQLQVKRASSSEEDYSASTTGAGPLTNHSRATLEFPRQRMLVGGNLQGCGLEKEPQGIQLNPNNVSVEKWNGNDQAASQIISQYQSKAMVGKNLFLTASTVNEDVDSSSDEEDNHYEGKVYEEENTDEDDGMSEHYSLTAISSSGRGRSAVQTWDPCQLEKHLVHDRYGTMCCDICKYGGDDDHIILCDGCCLGFHMYCVRPVLVNVPIGGKRAKRASLEEDEHTRDESRKMATDGYIHY